jgi:predicted ATPase
MTERFVLISGCSGGGKSTLLSALYDKSFATLPEPGRTTVQEKLSSS